MAAEVIAENQSDVSLQGGIIRNRVPTNITVEAGGEVGDAIEWQTIRDGKSVWIVGVVKKGAARGRVAPVRPQSTKKVAAPTTKKSAAKKPAKGNDLSDDIFGAAPVSKPKVAAPVKKVVRPTGARYDVPIRK